MAQRTIIETGTATQRFAFYLATTHEKMRFYLFEQPAEDGSTVVETIDVLDRGRLLGAGNKETAKLWATRLRLTNYVYVRV
jgi:hypothetical protein